MPEQTPAEIALDIINGEAGLLDEQAKLHRAMADQLDQIAADLRSVIPTIHEALPKAPAP